MKSKSKRMIALLMAVVTIFSSISITVAAEETTDPSTSATSTKTYYRYREKITMGKPYQISETSSAASEWTLYKIEPYREYCLRENGYILDYYTLTTANAITYERVKYYETSYSWDPNLVLDYEYLCVGYVYNTKYDGSGVDYEYTWKFTIPFTDSSGRTYYEYSGKKLYYQGTCQLYTLVVYSEYYYYYYKWSEWSEWSETPIEATDDIEVETKTVDLFTVIYDANGGRGAPEATTKEIDETVTLSAIVPTRENHQFLGWATSANGDAEYAPGDAYSDNADIILYAIWKNVTEYTVTYDVNGGAGAPATQTKVYGESIIISTGIPTRENHQFLGWSTSPAGTVEYAPGDAYSDNGNITLYAIWENVTEYTVTYDANGGTNVPAPQVKVHGEVITITSEIPIKDGYSFMGWSTVQDGEIEYISGATYSSDASVRLYAVWEENVNTIASGVCGEDLTWTLYDNGVLLISGTGAMYDWSSCSETPWWSYRTQIETIAVEEGCTTIGSYAFAILSGMTPYTIVNVHLPSTLTSINYRAFYLCASITAVVLPDNVETIDDYAFYKCTGIQALSFGENITTIGSYAFYTCTSLKNIKLNSKLESLGWYAFACCDSVETVELQENLKTIGLEAFISCDSLQKITVHPDNPYFANDAYGVLYDSANHILLQYPIGNQTSSYVIDDSTVEIARSAFSGCYNLQEVYLPKSLKIIDAYNFSNSVHEQIPVMYYAGTSEEWSENITVKASDSSGLYTAMTYEVVFNNGATEYVVKYETVAGSYPVGTKLSQIKVHDIDLIIESNMYSRSGYKFKGWSTTEDGNVEYLPGDIYSENADVTLYAVWEELPTELSVNSSVEISFSTGATSKYYSFIPEATGNYVIYSFDSMDTTVYLYDSSSNLLDYVESSSMEFLLDCNLQSNTEYLIEIRKTNSNWSGYVEFVLGETYSVQYDLNGGTGEVQDQVKLYGTDLVLSSIVPLRTDYVFNGWATTVDGAVVYEPGDSYTVNAKVTLYAVWSELSNYNVVYDANGGTGAPDTQTKKQGTSLVLSDVIPTKVGYIFRYWCPNADGTLQNALAVMGLESSHNYSNNMDKEWSISSPGATFITITFDSRTSLESNYDYLYIYDSEGSLVNKYTGTTLAGKSITVEGDTVTLRLTTDYSTTKWGFAVTSATAEMEPYGPGESYTSDADITLYAIWDICEHNWDEGVITTQPTHTTYGERTYTCADCSATKCEQISKVAHSYGAWAKVDDETHKRICECGDVETENHNWDTGVITTQPTHTTYGERTYTCEDCSAIKTEQVVKTTEHSYGSWTEVDAETHQRTCACGDVETESHNWNDGEITTQPTHMTFGIRTYTCEDCSATKTEQVAKTTEHSHGSWTEVDAETHQRTCACGDVETESHNWSDWQIRVDGSCTENGEKYRLCTKCYYEDIQIISATDHNYSNGICTGCGAEDPNADVSSAKYEMTDATGTAGSIVEIYVSIENNPGIISLRNTITYDTSALELIGVEDCGLLAGYTTPSATIISPYTIRWADSLATENNLSNGRIVKLTFQIKDGVEAGIYSISVAPVEARNVDGTKVTFSGASAIVNVIDCLIGDTDGDGEVSDWDAIVLNRYLAGWNVTIELAAADVDGDGEVSDWDAIVLERYLAGWNVELES